MVGKGVERKGIERRTGKRGEERVGFESSIEHSTTALLLVTQCIMLPT